MSVNKQLVIFGIGEMAEVAAYYFRTDSGRRLAGFTVDGKFLKEDTFNGLPVVGFEEMERLWPPDSHDLFIAVGYKELNALRARKMEEARARGYSLASYLNSRAWCWNEFQLEENAFILEHNTLQPFCKVGRGVTLWSGNHIGHHSRIGDFCFVASHVVVAGGVEIGARSFVGINASIRDHVKIGERCVIGAGALVLQDVPGDSVVAASATMRSKVPSSRLHKI